MRIKKKISARISAGYDGTRFYIAQKKALPGAKVVGGLITLNSAEAWRLKCWLGDAKSLWAIENMGEEDAAPLMDLLNVKNGLEKLDCNVREQENIEADHGD